jgi:Fe-S-cluster-containing hydrogenase component 2
LSAAKVATEPAECLGVRWSVKKAAEAEHVVRRQAGLIGWLRANLGIGPHMSADHHKKQAVKCDLCNGISGGPACVRACPTGAAWRGSPEEYLAMVREGQFRTSPRT